MIQNTPEEKAAAKAAKQAYKANNRNEKAKRVEFERKQAERKSKMILDGILEGEEILPDDYPVNFDFLYVVDDIIDGIIGKVVRSDIKGTIYQLKTNLRERGYCAANIYNCRLSKRNIL